MNSMLENNTTNHHFAERWCSVSVMQQQGRYARRICRTYRIREVQCREGRWYRNNWIGCESDVPLLKFDSLLSCTSATSVLGTYKQWKTNTN